MAKNGQEGVKDWKKAAGWLNPLGGQIFVLPWSPNQDPKGAPNFGEALNLGGVWLWFAVKIGTAPWGGKLRVEITRLCEYHRCAEIICAFLKK